MIRILLPLAAFAAPVALTAQAGPPQLGPEQRMLVRCSVAFAMIAHRQAAGDADALAFPPLGERGSEFFVRASAQVMDEASLDQAGIEAALTAEAQDIAESDTLDDVVRACLPLLPTDGS